MEQGHLAGARRQAGSARIKGAGQPRQQPAGQTGSYHGDRRLYAHQRRMGIGDSLGHV
jgi:hypothetical protein